MWQSLDKHRNLSLEVDIPGKNTESSYLHGFGIDNSILSITCRSSANH